MLVAQQFGHRDRVHPFQTFNTRDVAALQDTVDQQARFVLAQGAAQHRAHIAAGIGDQQTLRRRIVRETHDHLVDFVARDVAHPRNCLAQLLHLFGRKMLKHL